MALSAALPMGGLSRWFSGRNCWGSMAPMQVRGSNTLTPPVASPISWFRSDYGVYQDTGGVTPSVATSDPVALWTDIMGNHNLTQATGGIQPDYLTGAQNSLPAIRFARANHLSGKRINSSVFTGLATCTIFVVMKMTTIADGWNQDAVCLGNCTGPYNAGSVGNPSWRMYAGTEQSYLLEGSGVLSPRCHALNFTGGASSTAYVDGVLKTTADCGSATITQICLGANTGDSDAFGGWIAEILLYPLLNSTDRGSVETYLISRYGL